MSERVQLRWTDFQGVVTSSFGLLRKEEDLFDLTLISDDEVKIEAHKLVLSSSSAFFKSILKTSSTHHPVLYLGGVNSRILHSILDYIYEGEIQIYKEELKVFLDVAKKFRIDGLLSTHVSEMDPDQVVGTESKEQIFQMETEQVLATNAGTVSKENKTDSWMDQIEGLISSNNTFIENDATEESDNEDLVEELDEDFDEELLKNNSSVRLESKQKMSDIDLKIEELTEIKDGRKTCKVCNYSSFNSGHIKEHVELHIDGVKYICQFCRKTFHSRGIFRRHQKKQHKIQMSDIVDTTESLIKKKNGRYHCIVCDYNSRQTTHLREHVEIHVVGLSYPCDFCGKVLRTISSHRMHINKYHKGNKSN